MRSLLTRRRVLLVIAAAISIALVILVNFTGIFTLEVVTVNGQPLTKWEQETSLRRNRMLLRQPVHELASKLLEEHSTFKVDIDYRLPHQLEVRTNDFEPICFVLDKSTGRLRGLSQFGRVVPLPDRQIDWSNPVLTGLVADKLYDFCHDSRVALLIKQLQKLRQDHVDLYRLIDEVSFRNPDYLVVSILGLPYPLRAETAGFARQLQAFGMFMERYPANLDSVQVVDLRFGDIIVRKERKR